MTHKEIDQAVAIWLGRDPDQETRQEIQELHNAQEYAELEHRLKGRLQFGTAGLRGVIGAGTMRMNSLVVRETTAGLGRYLLDTIKDATTKGVVISYDARNGSKKFAHDAACVLAGLGMKAFLFQDVEPTPLCAFSVLQLKACAGIMVTASHNPPEYNGYKVYWQNGAQIIPPHDQGIAAQIEKMVSQDIPWLAFDQAKHDGLIVMMDAELEEQYLDQVQYLPGIINGKNQTKDISIAYSAMHGVGSKLAMQALKNSGFDQVFIVSEQDQPDGSFPTVVFPNPEEQGATELLLTLAQQHHVDVAFANDPDADRLAVIVPLPSGHYVQLTGDQIGVLLGEWLLRNGPQNAVVGNSIVSSRLLGKVAHDLGYEHYDSLTGFKWISNIAMEKIKQGQEFVFGYEEAIGFTVGNLVRDKDGISALVAFAQLSWECKQQGISIIEQLHRIYSKHGLYLTRQKSLSFQPGSDSPGDALRKQPPDSIAGIHIDSWMDLQTGIHHYGDNNETLSYPSSDVLIYLLEDHSRVIIRPSGTEPKLKCYYEIVQSVDGDINQAHTIGFERLEQLIENHQKELQLLN